MVMGEELRSTLVVSNGMTLEQTIEHLQRLLNNGFPRESMVEYKVQQNIHERSGTPMSPTVRMVVSHIHE